tara:strand:- start:40 stop:600 length:561 start_codon:yes stop_codon:yes gene_type:complete
MTTENTPNPYAHENDSIELSVSEMKGQRAIYLPVEVTVKMQGKYPVKDRPFNQVILEELNGFWNPPHELFAGAKGIALLSINKVSSGTLYWDIQSWEPVDGGPTSRELESHAEKVSVPVASSGGSVDGRNRSIERQVAVKALIELAPHCEGLVSAGFMKSETAARVVRKAVLGAEELLGELSEDNG